jgi:hypothetical protein
MTLGPLILLEHGRRFCFAASVSEPLNSAVYVECLLPLLCATTNLWSFFQLCYRLEQKSELFPESSQFLIEPLSISC